jgi:hypothetical protein
MSETQRRGREPDMEPVRAEFSVGKDAFGRLVTLKYYRGTGGEHVWAVHRDAGGQLDQSEEVTGLTADNLQAMASAASVFSRPR